MSDASFLVGALSDHAQGDAGAKEWRIGITRTLEKLTPVARTLVLSSPPGSENLIECRTVQATPSNCTGTLTTAVVRGLESAEKAAARDTGATYLDAFAFFCAPNGQCPSFVGATPVYVDGAHLTRQYSSYLAPGLATLLGLAPEDKTNVG